MEESLHESDKLFAEDQVKNDIDFLYETMSRFKKNNNIELLNEPTIKRQIRVGDNTFVFNVNNSDLETIQSISFSPSIIVSKIFDVENCEAFPYEDRFLFTSYKKISMMPGSWKKIRFYVSPREGGRAGSNIELEELFCLQVITAHAKYEYPFTIKSTKETNESLH